MKRGLLEGEGMREGGREKWMDGGWERGMKRGGGREGVRERATDGRWEDWKERRRLYTPYAHHQSVKEGGGEMVDGMEGGVVGGVVKKWEGKIVSIK